MDYTEVKQGRTFIVRFDDSEDMLEKLTELVKKENIRVGMVHLMGASSTSKVVLGPEKRAYPPVPSWWQFDDARELLGMAIIAWDGDVPKIHLHSGIGHSSESKVGCIREYCKVYLVIEAIIQEFVSENVSRKLDPKSNAALLSFN